MRTTRLHLRSALGAISDALLLLAALALPCALPLAAQTLDTTMVEVDGYTMRVLAGGLGTRDPGEAVVVFESGVGVPVESWGSVIPSVAEFAAVLAYDRFGVGQSDPNGLPATPPGRAAQLHALLQSLGVDPPIVVVGHGWGGVVAHYYSGLYPEEVAGAVYIDPIDVQKTRDDDVAMWEALGAREAEYDAYWSTYRQAARGAPAGLRGEYEAYISFQLSDLAGREVPSHPVVPVAVLLAAKYLPPPPGTELPYDPEAMFDASIRDRVEHFSEWLLGFPAATFVMATQAAHHIHVDVPDLVVEAVRRIVLEADSEGD